MERELINGPLLVLNRLGYLVPNSLKNVLLKTGMILLFSFVLSVAVMQYFYCDSGVIDIIDNTQIIFAVVQIFSKVILIIVHSHKILNLIQLRANFWNSNETTKSTKKRVNKTLLMVLKLQKFYGYCAVFSCVPFIFLAYIMDKKLPIGIWSTIEYTKLYKVAVPAYSLSVFFCAVLCYCFEGIFLGFCYEIVVQFKIFCDHLERMDVEDIESEQDVNNFYSQFIIYVKHHRFLCSFVTSFQDFYSAMFMVQYITSAPMICACFYGTFVSKNAVMKYQYGISCLTLTLQFAIYCIPLATLTEEITSVSTAVYNSNWYSKHHLKLKKATLLIIQQAQQEIRFTALGLIDINPPTLVDVCRVVVSTTTFLRSLD